MRCVEGFDHHCTWINNCIGQQNYHSFAAMIVAGDLTLLLFIVSVSLAGNYPTPLGITLWVLVSISAIFFLLLLILIVFHGYLHSVGLTTYGFFTKKKEKNVTLVEENREIGFEQQREPSREITQEVMRELTEEEVKEEGGAGALGE